MKYGKSFTYDNETKQYTLTDPIEVFSPQAVEKDLATHHYTCLDDTDTCTSINYVYSISSTTNTYNSVLYYIPLTGGKNVETALAEMFKSEHDSIIKDYLEDDWYVNHITDYEKYLEDTVWCNDRSYEDSKVNSGWNPNGGGMSQYLYFDTYYRFKNGTPSLKCKEKDSLTVANGGASKPIGLLTSDEAIYAGVSNSASSDYYIGGKGLMMSPYYFDRTDSTLFQMWSGSLSYTSSSSTNNIRPVVSLRYGAAWDGGDGTSEDPYVVMTG